MRETARVPRYRDHSCWLSRAEELRNVVHVRGAHPSGVEYPRSASKSINGVSIVHCPSGHALDGNIRLFNGGFQMLIRCFGALKWHADWSQKASERVRGSLKSAPECLKSALELQRKRLKTKP